MPSSADTTQLRAAYPISQQFRIEFSPHEDRLILTAMRGGQGQVRLMLTRRIVIVMLQQLLKRLPSLMGLDKTPAEYWRDVLEMAHQRAMEAKKQAPQAAPRPWAPAAERAAAVDTPPLYLATGLVLQTRGAQLMLAFKGLPLPLPLSRPADTASSHEPVLAAPLQIDHVHQLLHLLIDKAEAAQWHLPLNLPWLETMHPDAGEPGLASKNH
jgi:hypothetical protein